MAREIGWSNKEILLWQIKEAIQQAAETGTPVATTTTTTTSTTTTSTTTTSTTTTTTTTL